MPSSEEVFLSLPAERRALVPPLSHAKGTWLGAEVYTLQQIGRFDQYMQALAPELRDTMRHSVARDWHPLDVVLAHYAACDSLGLTAAELLDFGASSTRHAQGKALEMAAKLAKTASVGPWTMLGQLQRFWDRFMRGGGIGVWKLGPKEARIEIIQVPPCRYRFFVTATRGVLRNAVEPYCTRVYLTELPALASPLDMAIRAAWA